jgi:hypothetical protein
MKNVHSKNRVVSLSFVLCVFNSSFLSVLVVIGCEYDCVFYCLLFFVTYTMSSLTFYVYLFFVLFSFFFCFLFLFSFFVFFFSFLFCFFLFFFCCFFAYLFVCIVFCLVSDWNFIALPYVGLSSLSVCWLWFDFRLCWRSRCSYRVCSYWGMVLRSRLYSYVLSFVFSRLAVVSVCIVVLAVVILCVYVVYLIFVFILYCYRLSFLFFILVGF